MADHVATVAVRFTIVLGVFLLGITALWLEQQAGRAAAWFWRRCAHG